jgi:predicted TIM-barrel enzyme
MTVFAKATILQGLRHTLQDGGSILAAGASTGLVAKSAAAGGADLLVVYSTGRSRHMGLPTTVLGDSNATTVAMADEIANVVDDVPIIGGVEASDPRFRDLSRLIDRFVAAGYSGVINFPTLGLMPDRSRQREDVGLGYSRDIELARVAAARGVFSMVYVFEEEQARAMAQVGADCIVAHVGLTSGGMVGSTSSATSKPKAIEAVVAMHAAARAVNPDVIVLAHGGPFSGPEDMADLYAQTDCHGFVGASSIERIPIERAVAGVVREFKAVGRPRAQRPSTVSR